MFAKEGVGGGGAGFSGGSFCVEGCWRGLWRDVWRDVEEGARAGANSTPGGEQYDGGARQRIGGAGANSTMVARGWSVDIRVR